MAFIVGIHAINAAAAVVVPLFLLHFYICQLVCLILCHDFNVRCAIQNCRLGSIHSFKSNWYIVFTININYKISKSPYWFSLFILVPRVYIFVWCCYCVVFNMGVLLSIKYIYIGKSTKRNNAFLPCFRSVVYAPSI